MEQLTTRRLTSREHTVALGPVGKPDLASSGPFSAWRHPAVSTIELTSPGCDPSSDGKIARSRADDGIFRQSLVAGALCFFCVIGCRPNGHMPKIVQGSGERDLMLSIPAPIEIPKRAPVETPSQNRHGNIPERWYPPQTSEKPWAGIVIHHSGTPNGNMDIFDRWHREGNLWDGVGYDFVIGNGTDSGDGQIEVTFRWREQKTGAHCKTANNWANENTIGICLVGDFEQTPPSQHQMQALAQLIGFLQERYHIPLHRLYGHNSTPGARFTECPGSHFSFSDLHALLVR